MSLHHKFSLLYYLLLDFDESDARNLASDNFATVSGMPKNYQILMKGLWQLDQQQFSVCSHPLTREHMTNALSESS